jgi:hypothetical protein
VGGGGPNAPASKPDYSNESLLALPNLASLREVSATLTKNPVLPAGAGEYDWPAINANDLATTAIRVVAAPVANTTGDTYKVELDAAWLDVYGWQKQRPGEVKRAHHRTRGWRHPRPVVRLTPERAALQPLHRPPGHPPRRRLRPRRAAHRRAAVRATNTDAGGGRRNVALAPALQPGESAYFLVTAHVDDVESPAGTRAGSRDRPLAVHFAADFATEPSSLAV